MDLRTAEGREGRREEERMLHTLTASFPLPGRDGGTTSVGWEGQEPLPGVSVSPLALSLSPAEALASPTPSRQPDPRGQGWHGGTPGSSRSPPETSPRPAWGCWAPRGCWAPPSAALLPALPSSSKADRLVGVSSSSIHFPRASFVFPSLTCPDPLCAVGCGSGSSGRGINQAAEGEKLSP